LRQQYAFRRYLRDMPLSAIKNRAVYIVSNMIRVEHDGRVGLLPLNSIAHLSELFIHVQEEHRLRNLAEPQLTEIATELSKTYIPLANSSTKVNIDIEKFQLCKFAKYLYAKSLLENGELLIRPASDFMDNAFNKAIQDEELKSSSFIPKREVTILAQDKDGPREISPLTNVEYSVTSDVEFYLCSFSNTFKPRLFIDLGYDACVLIKDKTEFEYRLYNSSLKQLPEWSCYHASISYHDGILGSFMTTPAPYFSKGLAYQYQDEYRYAWLPEQRPSQRLEKMLLTLGSLSDIAEIIKL